MRHILHGAGTVRADVPDDGRLRHRGLLGRGDHHPGPHRQVRSGLEVHPTRHQRSDLSNYFLYLVRSPSIVISG